MNIFNEHSAFFHCSTPGDEQSLFSVHPSSLRQAAGGALKGAG